MRAASLASLLAGLAIGAAGAEEPPVATPGTGARVPYDHYDPIALDQLARERLREGDVGTACVLVARAARLAPHDRRIARNLEELETVAVPETAPVRAPPAAAQPAGSLEVPPEPPPLWPAK